MGAATATLEAALCAPTGRGPASRRSMIAEMRRQPGPRPRPPEQRGRARSGRPACSTTSASSPSPRDPHQPGRAQRPGVADRVRAPEDRPGGPRAGRRAARRGDDRAPPPRVVRRPGLSRTACPARRSRSAPGSSPSPTRTRRWSPAARTASAITHDKAIAELRRHAGIQFDPDLVRLFSVLFAEGVPWQPDEHDFAHVRSDERRLADARPDPRRPARAPPDGDPRRAARSAGGDERDRRQRRLRRPDRDDGLTRGGASRSAPPPRRSARPPHARSRSSSSRCPRIRGCQSSVSSMPRRATAGSCRAMAPATAGRMPRPPGVRTVPPTDPSDADAPVWVRRLGDRAGVVSGAGQTRSRCRWTPVRTGPWSARPAPGGPERPTADDQVRGPAEPDPRRYCRSMPDLPTRVRAWSYRRQRLDRTAADIPAALADVVAVYATQPTAILSLAARVADLRASRLSTPRRGPIRRSDPGDALVGPPRPDGERSPGSRPRHAARPRPSTGSGAAWA